MSVDTTRRMTLKRGPYAAAIVAASLMGGNFVAVRLPPDHFDPYFLTLLRFAIVAMLIPFVGWPKVPTSTLLIYAVSSGVGQYLLSTVAIQLGLSPGLAALLMQSQVFMSLALGFAILGETVRTSTILGSVLGLAGLTCVLATGGSKAPWIASLVCLVSAAGWAVANVTIKRTAESVIGLQCASALICLPAIWFARELLLPGAPSVAAMLEQAPLASWLPVAYTAIMSFALAQVLWGRAISTIGLAAT